MKAAELVKDLETELEKAHRVIEVMMAHFRSLPSGFIREYTLTRLAEDLEVRGLGDHDETRAAVLRAVCQ